MIDQYPPANGVLTSLIWRKTAAGGETSLSGYDNASQALSYTPGQEQVYLNGILLVRGDDYTATNGTSITGLTALAAGDFVQVNCYNNFSVASVPATSITGAVSNAQLANSSITINGNAVSLGGSVSLPGDIEGVTAGIGISGGGTSGTVTITNDMATTISAKGDLVVGTANDAYTALTVGANNTVLTADSTTATGLKWATVSAGGMTLLSTTTLNGAASYTVSSISADYVDLYILIVGSKTGSESNKNRLRVSSSATNNNTITRWGLSSGTSNNGEAITLDADQIFTKNTSTPNSYAITIYGYANTVGYKPIQFTSILNDSTTKIQAMGAASFADTAAITEIQYSNWAGANFTGGTMYVYGVK